MSDSEDQVSRRKLFHILGAATATAGVLGAQSHDHTAMANPAVSTPKGPYQRRVLDDHQWKTVQVLCALIIPADAHSGSATDAGVPEFIDDWLDFRNHEDGNQNFSAQILGGLAWLDRESMHLSQVSFAEASVGQQNQLLDRVAWPERASASDKAWVDFFNKFRDLVVSGYVSSKTGIAYLPYLGNRAVARWEGCDPKVWAILEERMNNGYKGLGGVVAPFT